MQSSFYQLQRIERGIGRDQWCDGRCLVTTSNQWINRWMPAEGALQMRPIRPLSTSLFRRLPSASPRSIQTTYPFCSLYGSFIGWLPSPTDPLTCCHCGCPGKVPFCTVSHRDCDPRANSHTATRRRCVGVSTRVHGQYAYPGEPGSGARRGYTGRARHPTRNRVGDSHSLKRVDERRE